MIGAIIITLIMGGSWGYIVGIDVSTSRLQTQAIERGYALHCPVDGTFAWNGECEE